MRDRRCDGSHVDALGRGRRSWRRPARADVYDDNPATASRGPHDTWVFARAHDGSISSATDATGWTTGSRSAATPPARPRSPTAARSTSSSAAPTARPTRTPTGNGLERLALARRLRDLGARGRARARGRCSTSWSRAATTRCTTRPTPGTGWSGFAPIGGNLTSGASVNSQARDLNIWARGTDGAVQQSWTGAAWIDWPSSAAGSSARRPRFARDNIIDVYVRGAGNATYQRVLDPGRLGRAGPCSTPRRSTPRPRPPRGRPNREWIVARRGAVARLQRMDAAAGWTGGSDLGPVAVPRRRAARAAPGRRRPTAR